MSDHGQIDLPKYIGGQLLRFVRRRLRRRGRTLGQLLLPQWTRTSDGEVDRYEIGWLLYIRSNAQGDARARAIGSTRQTVSLRDAIGDQGPTLRAGFWRVFVLHGRRARLWERFVIVSCRKRSDEEQFARKIYHVRVGVCEREDHGDLTAAIEAE